MAPQSQPIITLVIPAAPGILVEALESVKAQTRPVEVMVEEGVIPSSNRNRGAQRSRTPLVGFTNAHSLLRPDWAEQVESFFRAHPEIAIVGGPQLNCPGDSYFAKLSGEALACRFCTGKMSRRYEPGKLSLKADESELTSANLVCKREVFEKVVFDESIYPGEDPKFISEAAAAGFKIASSPEIVVFNHRRSNAMALWKQIFNYGASRVRLTPLAGLLKHPQFFAPSGLLVYLAMLPLLSRWSTYWMLPLLLYAVFALLFAAARSVTRRRLDFLPLLPLLFLWIHLAYGCGFLGRFVRGGWSKGVARGVRDSVSNRIQA